MRAYIKINGVECAIGSISWNADGSISNIVTTSNGVDNVAFQKFSWNEDTLDQFETADIVHADLANKIYWRES